MNKKEAIVEMMQGKKVTNQHIDGYLYMNDNQEFVYYEDTLGNYFELVNMNTVNQNNWQIYKEPKKKVKFYQYVYRGEVVDHLYSECGTIQLRGDNHTTPSCSWSRPNLLHRTNTFIEIEI